MQDFSSKVLCVGLRTSCLGVTSTDVEATLDMANRYNATTRQVSVSRKILSNRTKESGIYGVAPMLKIRQRARNLMRLQTLPGLTPDLRIILPGRLASLRQALEALQAEDNLAVAQLIADWELEIAYDRSPRGLGDRFDIDLYPQKEFVASCFEIGLTVTDFPKGDFARFGLISEQLAADHEAMLLEVGRAARNEVRRQLAEKLRRIIDKMTDPAVEKYHESIFSNLTDLLEVVPELNITGDPVIEEVRLDCLAKLSVQIETIKASSFMKDTIAQNAKSILSKLGGSTRKILAA